MEPAFGLKPGSEETSLPDLWLGLFDSAVTIDLERERILITATGLPHTGDRARQRADCRIRELTAAIESAAADPMDSLPPAPTALAARDGFESNFTDFEFAGAVNRIQEFIAAGDIYQANLSQRFRTRYEGDPFQLFLELRRTAPAPFSAFLDGGDFTVVSMSPERFLHLDPETRRVETRPIKGTRPRGKTGSEDRLLARELVQSEKDRAEHVMIVDLERNDLGRVAQVGTVQVRELSLLETFPTLFHLTSTVEGVLASGRDRVDLLQATFPGGSITGAPKIRAMQVIDELETVRRGIYTGSLGPPELYRRDGSECGHSHHRDPRGTSGVSRGRRNRRRQRSRGGIPGDSGQGPVAAGGAGGCRDTGPGPAFADPPRGCWQIGFSNRIAVLPPGKPGAGRDASNMWWA